MPRLVPTSSTTLRVSWPAGYDRDDYTLTYQVIRNGATGTPRFTTTANSNWWTLPALGFVDTGLTPGATYTLPDRGQRPDGNTVFGASAAVTMPHVVQPEQRLRAVGAQPTAPGSTGR